MIAYEVFDCFVELFYIMVVCRSAAHDCSCSRAGAGGAND